mmetsp:Transcript_23843/g.81281  ORF Transcript_23843/g.81281 Transcript_23843/m.81281 type:complete len:575 (+) Transcript_23843:274-1998(+)
MLRRHPGRGGGRILTPPATVHLPLQLIDFPIYTRHVRVHLLEQRHHGLVLRGRLLREDVVHRLRNRPDLLLRVRVAARPHWGETVQPSGPGPRVGVRNRGRSKLLEHVPEARLRPLFAAALSAGTLLGCCHRTRAPHAMNRTGVPPPERLVRAGVAAPRLGVALQQLLVPLARHVPQHLCTFREFRHGPGQVAPPEYVQVAVRHRLHRRSPLARQQQRYLPEEAPLRELRYHFPRFVEHVHDSAADEEHFRAVVACIEHDLVLNEDMREHLRHEAFYEVRLRVPEHRHGAYHVGVHVPAYVVVQRAGELLEVRDPLGAWVGVRREVVEVVLHALLDLQRQAEVPQGVAHQVLPLAVPRRRHVEVAHQEGHVTHDGGVEARAKYEHAGAEHPLVVRLRLHVVAHHEQECRVEALEVHGGEVVPVLLHGQRVDPPADRAVAEEVPQACDPVRDEYHEEDQPHDSEHVGVLHALKEPEEAAEAQQPGRLKDGEHLEVGGGEPEEERQDLERQRGEEVYWEPVREVVARDLARVGHQHASRVYVRRAEVEPDVYREQRVDDVVQHDEPVHLVRAEAEL